MHISQVAGYISGILVLISFAPYVRDIFKGITKPERASWFIWSLLNLIAFFSQYAKQATDSLWFSGVQVAGDIFVFVLAIKFGIGGFMKRDVFGLIAAGIGLALWYVTREAAFALFIAIGIDAVGLLLTVLKAYERPKTETMSSWVLTWLAGLFAIVSVGRINLVLLAWPFYIFIAGLSVITAMKLGLGHKTEPSLQ